MATSQRSSQVVQQCWKLLSRCRLPVQPQAVAGDGPSTSFLSQPFTSWLHGSAPSMRPMATSSSRSFGSGTSTLCSTGRALQQHGRMGLTGLPLARPPILQYGPQMFAPGRSIWSLSRSPSGMLGNFFAPGRRMTNTLVLVGVCMYLLEQRYPVLIPLLARINYMVARGQYWRLVTSAFVHAGILHLLTNMLSLYYVGPMLEAVLGPQRFLIVYLGSAVTANLLSYYMQPPNRMSLGASGSVCGILGGYVAYRFVNRSIIGFGGPELTWLAQIVGINLLLQLAVPGIDGWSHLGGAVGGFALVYALLALRRGPAAYQQWRR